MCLVRGEGSYVWDAEGNATSTSSPAGAATCSATARRASSRRCRSRSPQLIHVPNTWYTEPQGLLAKALSERAGFDGQCFFCNSGTEANEAAIKLARLNGKPRALQDHHHAQQLPRPHDGRLTATGQPKYHQGVEPMLAGFSYAPFGDLDAVAKLIDGETCAIMVEPIQGEGGINLPPAGYLEGLRELCRQAQLLLIFDEVQTGMGRTGKWYAYQHWHVEPDAMTLAKALAGGVACGGLIAKPEFAEKLGPARTRRRSAATRSPARAALATIETIEADGLLRTGRPDRRRLPRSVSRRLQEPLPAIQEVRVKGAMIGVELTDRRQRPSSISA